MEELSVLRLHTARTSGGFLYDSDSYADDLPFWKFVDIDGVETPQLVVPYAAFHSRAFLQSLTLPSSFLSLVVLAVATDIP